jgi:hypothetical protein
MHGRGCATFGSTNQSVNFCAWKGEIVLDIAATFTYHTHAFANGLASNAEEMFRGNGLNRGADSHDE